jgi:hypothetical protein
LKNIKRVGRWWVRWNKKDRYKKIFTLAKSHFWAKKEKKKVIWDALTLRKSISWVINVPSVLWNSNIIMSSWTFDVIVSCTTSPPCNEKKNERVLFFMLHHLKNKNKLSTYWRHPGIVCPEISHENSCMTYTPLQHKMSFSVSLSKWYGVNNGNMSTKPLNYVMWVYRISYWSQERVYEYSAYG